MDTPGQPNGQLASHEQRLQHLEQANTDLIGQVSAGNVKLDVLKESLDALTLAIHDLTKTVSSQNARIEPLEQKDFARSRRTAFIRKGITAIALTLAGGLATKAAAFLFQ